MAKPTLQLSRMMHRLLTLLLTATIVIQAGVSLLLLRRWANVDESARQLLLGIAIGNIAAFLLTLYVWFFLVILWFRRPDEAILTRDVADRVDPWQEAGRRVEPLDEADDEEDDDPWGQEEEDDPRDPRDPHDPHDPHNPRDPHKKNSPWRDDG